MIFFDSHLHVYPEYDLDTLFSAVADRARKLAPDASGIAVAVLLRSFQPNLASVFGSAMTPRKWRLSPPETPRECWTASCAGGPEITIFPARQVAARERIELLAYFGEEPFPDGLTLAESARGLASLGYLPCLAWGRGKWLFGRAGIVRGLLRDPSFKATVPFVGDSALRPWFWPEPLFGEARRHGFRVICGSDPLPGKGGERAAGRYATLIDSPPVFSKAAMSGLLKTAPVQLVR